MTSPSTTPYILIEEGRSIEIAATNDGSTLRLAARPLLESLGWAQKPEGLCKGDVCIPIASRPDLINEHGVDLAALAEVLGRPVVINRDESAASMGSATEAHGTQLAGGVAPDFTLPDLSGTEHTLSDYRGKKVLLIAYASW
ncbi:MAG: redoxin domain-containing protein [Deltaproteobacteria bacterium]|nr:redoxin domain-containing protein [Deltaproteobacteria bacterium]MBW2387534.1 redoxin domain-containing protein [Deltaproteobacteria bacterium]MBW2726042.1 redoxin domain-containing protein [Deltaproteobacteria bacterium]